MKKILVPVDFSVLSDNAADYAAQLTKHFEAELILIHVFYVPVFVQDEAVIFPTTNELEKESIENLEKMKQKMLNAYGNLNVSYHYVQGIFVDEINTYAIQKQIDLIVIGAQGIGYIKERLFGSMTTALIRSSGTDILVINKKVQFRKPERIALTVDFAESYNNVNFQPLKQFVELFNSHVSVLNVISGSDVTESDEIMENYQLAHVLKYMKHNYYQTQNEEVIEGINKFVKQHDIHLVVMITRSHSLISRIFNEPHTKEMAFHSEVALLVLHKQTT